MHIHLHITVVEIAAVGGNNNIEIVLNNCAAVTDWISEIDNTQINNAKEIDIVMPIYDYLEYSGNYFKNLEVYGNKLETKQL